MASGKALIRKVTARAYRIPTTAPEADGTATWDATVLVLASVEAGGKQGIGYTYAHQAVAVLINELLAGIVAEQNPFDIPHIWRDMRVAIRNLGQSGIVACAMAAVDNALWDLKAKLLDTPLIHLLGKRRDAVSVYGSGGFTTLGPAQVAAQITEWSGQGITLFKIKIGRDEQKDMERIQAAVKALPKGGRLFVDANGAYSPKQALAMAQNMAEYDVAWFEEPVTSDDITGLNFVRQHAPAGMEIAAGEYSYALDDARRLLEADAVDVLQLDATRCQGLTGFLKGAALAEAYHRPVSSHCAPALHVDAMCHIQQGRHIEYFQDHARIEHLLFDGVPEVREGRLVSQDERPGFGWAFKTQDAEKFAL